jgi:hypothetical protein
MSTDHIVALLIAERDKLNQAIEALQGPTKRLGRPPKNPLAAAVSVPTARRPLSAATRRKMAAGQKKRWAAKKALKP